MTKVRNFLIRFEIEISSVIGFIFSNENLQVYKVLINTSYLRSWSHPKKRQSINMPGWTPVRLVVVRQLHKETRQKKNDNLRLSPHSHKHWRSRNRWGWTWAWPLILIYRCTCGKKKKLDTFFSYCCCCKYNPYCPYIYP